ncbi:hypothetical protein CGLO_12000 [Colletotrichum gloeosporioides Cg-14]|nr:hypothetical protein CGLO_12000 [Colletotrichum gloeosporioides Cg-14]
MVNETS